MQISAEIGWADAATMDINKTSTESSRLNDSLKIWRMIEMENDQPIHDVRVHKWQRRWMSTLDFHPKEELQVSEEDNRHSTGME